jgi:hypothetical protein
MRLTNSSLTAPGRHCGGTGKFFGHRMIKGTRSPLS